MASMQEAKDIKDNEARTVEVNYNNMQSSILLYNENQQLQQFNTYSAIIIKRYIFDSITVDNLKEMVLSLVALAENTFQSNKDGQRRKYNVKLQIQKVLENDKSNNSMKIADVLLEQMIEDVLKNNSKRQLMQIADNLLKIAIKTTSCLRGCM